MSFLQLILGKAPLFPTRFFIGTPKKFPAAKKGEPVWVEGIRPLKMDGCFGWNFWGVLGVLNDW